MKSARTIYPPGGHPYLDSFCAGTKAELSSRTPNLRAATRTAHMHLDEAFEKLVRESGRTIACRAGCAFCCHLKVDVQAAEAFVIADYIRAKFTPTEVDQVRSRARENWTRIQPMTVDQQESSGLPCPLLREGRCSVYPVRPAMCRVMHSQRVEPCQDQSSTSVEPITSVRVATAGAVIGISQAFAEHGYDAQAYDLNAALLEALDNPKSERRFRDKKSAFLRTMIAKEQPEDQQ